MTILHWSGKSGWVPAVSLVAALAVLAGCGGRPRPVGLPGTATPVYNEVTGELEALESDTNGDGAVDTRARMNGVRLQSIEIDRNYDGVVDRWEFYVDNPGAPAAARSPDGRSVLDHVEEANGDGETVTRREFYVDGVIRRVEEDTDADGQLDKWEDYLNGRLRFMALDLDRVGHATRRLVYTSTGDVERVEIDPDGDGQFVPAPEAGGGSR